MRRRRGRDADLRVVHDRELRQLPKTRRVYFSDNPGTPFKLAGARNVEIDAKMFAQSPQAIFSGGPAYSGVPVKWNGHNDFFTVNVIDPNYPVGVFVPIQEMTGSKTLTPSGNNPIVVPQTDGASQYQDGTAFWREYQIATGGWTGTQTVTWPANPGKIYAGRNNNAQSANLLRAGSPSPVTVTTGARWLVKDNGTDLVSL